MTTTVYRGPSILGLLGIAFVVLKLCGVIEWHWIWVLAPFWGPLVVVLCVVGFAIIAVLITGLCAWLAKPKRG